MEVVSTTVVASAVGALLFFVSGYLARALRHNAGGESAVIDDAAEIARRQAEEARREAETAREELAEQREALERARELETRVNSRTAELAAARDRIGEAEREKQLLKRRSRELEQQVAKLAAAFDEQQTNVDQKPSAEAGRSVERLEAQARELRRELEAQKRKTTQAEERLTRKTAQAEEQARRAREGAAKSERQAARAGEELAAARRAAAEARSGAAERQALAQRAARSEELQARVDELTVALERARTEAVPLQEVTQLRKKQRDMLIRAQMMQQRVTEMERHAQENALLRQQLVHYDELEDTVAQLRQQVRDLEARGFAARVAAGAQPSLQAAPQSGNDVPRGAAMDQLIGALVQSGRSQSVVVADAHGLLLASSGDNELHEGLGVISGIIGQLGDQSRELLPMAEVQRVELVDENGVSLVSRLFQHGGHPLALTYVGGGGASPDRKVDTVVASLARIMETGASL